MITEAHNQCTMNAGERHVSSSKPQEHCSPPQKPPRRRHSEQLAKSADSPRSSVRNFNISLPLTSIQHAETQFISGSESLPANWIPEYKENPDEEKKIIFNGMKLNSLPPKYDFSSYISAKASALNQCSHLDTSNYVKHNDVSTSACNSSLDKMPSLPINSVKAISKVPSEEKESGFSSWGKCAFANNGAEYFEAVIPQPYHRRHHSDPIIPKVNKSFYDVQNITHKLLKEVPNFEMMNLEKSHSPVKQDVHRSEEVMMLKDTNDKLWKYLCQVQEELDNCLANQESSKCDHESFHTFSDLICDMYNAQKEKDHAFESRLKSVMDERDAAIKALEELTLSVTRSSEDFDMSKGGTKADQELKKLFQEIESEQHPVKMMQQQHNLLTYIYQAKENRLHHLSHQLELCMEEKKQITEKVEKLEEELIKWKSSRCLLHTDVKQWETNLLDALCEAISQRDAAVKQSRFYEEQLQLFQIHHSNCEMPKHSRNNVNSSDDESMKFDLCSKNSGSIGPETFQIDIDSSAANNFDSSDESELLRSKINYLFKSLNIEIKRRQTAEENCHKLERLVLLLRRKINGINVGIPV